MEISKVKKYNQIHFYWTDKKTAAEVLYLN